MARESHTTDQRSRPSNGDARRLRHSRIQELVGSTGFGRKRKFEDVSQSDSTSAKLTAFEFEGTVPAKKIKKDEHPVPRSASDLVRDDSGSSVRSGTDSEKLDEDSDPESLFFKDRAVNKDDDRLSKSGCQEDNGLKSLINKQSMTKNTKHIRRVGTEEGTAVANKLKPQEETKSFSSELATAKKENEQREQDTNVAPSPTKFPKRSLSGLLYTDRRKQEMKKSAARWKAAFEQEEQRKGQATNSAKSPKNIEVDGGAEFPTEKQDNHRDSGKQAASSDVDTDAERERKRPKEQTSSTPERRDGARRATTPTEEEAYRIVVDWQERGSNDEEDGTDRVRFAKVVIEKGMVRRELEREKKLQEVGRFRGEHPESISRAIEEYR